MVEEGTIVKVGPAAIDVKLDSSGEVIEVDTTPLQSRVFSVIEEGEHVISPSWGMTGLTLTFTKAEIDLLVEALVSYKRTVKSLYEQTVLAESHQAIDSMAIKIDNVLDKLNEDGGL